MAEISARSRPQNWEDNDQLLFGTYEEKSFLDSSVNWNFHPLCKSMDTFIVDEGSRIIPATLVTEKPWFQAYDWGVSEAEMLPDRYYTIKPSHTYSLLSVAFVKYKFHASAPPFYVRRTYLEGPNYKGDPIRMMFDNVPGFGIRIRSESSCCLPDDGPLLPPLYSSPVAPSTLDRVATYNLHGCRHKTRKRVKLIDGLTESGYAVLDTHLKFTKFIINQCYSHVFKFNQILVRSSFYNRTGVDLLYDNMCADIEHNAFFESRRNPELTLMYTKCTTAKGNPFLKLYLCFGNICFRALEFPFDPAYGDLRGLRLLISYKRDLNGGGVQIVKCPVKIFSPNNTTISTCKIVKSNSVIDAIAENDQHGHLFPMRQINITETQAEHISRGLFFRPGYDRPNYVLTKDYISNP